jgi:hypothetical protein
VTQTQAKTTAATWTVLGWMQDDAPCLRAGAVAAARRVLEETGGDSARALAAAAAFVNGAVDAHVLDAAAGSPLVRGLLGLALRDVQWHGIAEALLWGQESRGGNGRR